VAPPVIGAPAVGVTRRWCRPSSVPLRWGLPRGGAAGH